MALDSQQSVSPVPEVSPVEAQRLIDGGAFLLDVREPDEFAAAHVQGGQLVPLGQLAGRVSELPQAGTVVVICRSGRRSAEAVRLLEQSGFERPLNLAGGILAWRAAGLPVEE